MPIPEGFATITPYFFVKDADAFGEFLVKAFAGVQTLCTRRDDGVVANMQVRVGHHTVMISEATPDYPAMKAAYYLYVENADLTQASALAAGAALEMEVMDMDYGDRQGGVRDPFGNIWWISQRLTEAPYEQ